MTLEPVTAPNAPHLRHAIRRFAKGRRLAPARLNFGDLFAYALTRRLDLPSCTGATTSPAPTHDPRGLPAEGEDTC